jgi:hypothetical protein
MHVDSDSELLRLQTALRDLVALLQLDFAFVRTGAGMPTETTSNDQSPEMSATPAHVLRGELRPGNEAASLPTG